jgi:hypothetical protein
MDDQQEQEQERIDESLAEIVQAQLWQHDYGTGGLEEYNENLLEQIRVDTFSEPTRTDEEDVVANLGDDFYDQFNDVGQGEAVRDFTQGLLCSLQTEENEPGQVQAEENEPGQVQAEENEPEQGLGTNLQGLWALRWAPQMPTQQTQGPMQRMWRKPDL